MLPKSESGSITTRLVTLKKWVNNISLSPKDREVVVTYTNKKEIDILKNEFEIKLISISSDL